MFLTIHLQLATSTLYMHLPTLTLTLYNIPMYLVRQVVFQLEIHYSQDYEFVFGYTFLQSPVQSTYIEHWFVGMQTPVEEKNKQRRMMGDRFMALIIIR